jgi:hypothetical protein
MTWGSAAAVQPIEKRIIAALVADMRAQGHDPAAVWTGERYVMASGAELRDYLEGEQPGTIDRALTDAEIMATLDAYGGSLHFTWRAFRCWFLPLLPAGSCANWGRCGVLLALGNGREVITDYHRLEGDFSLIAHDVLEHAQAGAFG